MSFINSATGHEFKAGHFLAYGDENCVRQTKTIPANHAQVKTNADGTKYVPAGAIFPANDATAIGIVYEDVDVTSGAMPGSVVTKGVVYADKLPAAPAAAATSALTDIKFIASTPAITRPY